MRIKSVIQAELLSVVGAKVSQYGFRAKPIGQSFYRKFPLGKHAFHLSFIPHPLDFDITADFGIRFEQVELLIGETGGTHEEKYKRKTFTMGAEIGNYTQGSPIRWTIEKEEDIIPVSEMIFESFQKVVLPYYETYDQLDKAFALLKRNDDEAVINCPFDNKRTKNALALAVILERAEEICPIIEESFRYLQRYEKEFDIADFTQFKDSLAAKGYI